MKRTLNRLFLPLLLLFLLTGCQEEQAPALTGGAFSLDEIPAYSGEPYVQVNDNVPYFTADELTEEPFETYSPLDALGRCGVAYANICLDIMPTEPRGEIGMIRPSGWHTVRYDDVVNGKYLYNRCHLIGYQLAGENANELNLITGTRYLNVEGMLPFEDQVDDYVDDTGNHVLYRVTPIFTGDNLVADGVLMEALSVEDQGAGVTFCVFCYNVQPGITIDYATGDSRLDDGQWAAEAPQTVDYVLNTNSMRFHLPTCSSVDTIADHNRQDYTGTREELIESGYTPCGICKP